MSGKQQGGEIDAYGRILRNNHVMTSILNVGCTEGYQNLTNGE